MADGVTWTRGTLLGCILGACAPSAALDEPSPRAESIVANLLEAGYAPEDIEITPDDEVVAQGDIKFDLEASELRRDSEFRQYVTAVTVSQSIDDILIWVAPRLRETTFIAAVDGAIAQWNGVADSRLKLQRVAGCLPPDSSATVGVIEVTLMDSPATCDRPTPGDPTREINAVARFPTSGGQPGAEIEINPCLLGKSRVNQTSTLMHELGHCLGFRHTDFANHSSCGGAPFDEGELSVGAARVPGTPSVAQGDPDSILNACAPVEQSGVWSDADRHAIRVIYGRGGGD